MVVEHNVRSSDTLGIFCAGFGEFRDIKKDRRAPIWGSGLEFREISIFRDKNFDYRELESRKVTSKTHSAALNRSEMT